MVLNIYFLQVVSLKNKNTTTIKQFQSSNILLKINIKIKSLNIEQINFRKNNYISKIFLILSESGRIWPEITIL